MKHLTDPDMIAFVEKVFEENNVVMITKAGKKVEIMVFIPGGLNIDVQQATGANLDQAVNALRDRYYKEEPSE